MARSFDDSLETDMAKSMPRIINGGIRGEAQIDDASTFSQSARWAKICMRHDHGRSSHHICDAIFSTKVVGTERGGERVIREWPSIGHQMPRPARAFAGRGGDRIIRGGAVAERGRTSRRCAEAEEQEDGTPRHRTSPRGNPGGLRDRRSHRVASGLRVGHRAVTLPTRCRLWRARCKWRP